MTALHSETTGPDQVPRETGLRTWETEASRFFDEIAAQSRATLEALCKCESPVDVLAVEQAWVKARSEAYLDSGLRFASAFASVAQSLSSPDEPEQPERGAAARR